MTIGLILYIILAHWVADFVFQTDEMAKGKSTSFKTLINHTLTYSGIMALALFLPSLLVGLTGHMVAYIAEFAFITFITHTAIDYYTSKANSILWEKKEVHNFFVSIGFDQVLHYIQLFLTLYFLR